MKLLQPMSYPAVVKESVARCLRPEDQNIPDRLFTVALEVVTKLARHQESTHEYESQPSSQFACICMTRMGNAMHDWVLVVTKQVSRSVLFQQHDQLSVIERSSWQLAFGFIEQVAAWRLSQASSSNADAYTQQQVLEVQTICAACLHHALKSWTDASD